MAAGLYFQKWIMFNMSMGNISEDFNLAIFSERLRKARNEMKLTQFDLASKAGVMPSAISDYESGKRSPSGDKIWKLARALCVTTDYLLGLDTDPDAPKPESKPQNPVADEVLNDETFWRSRGIFPPSEDEKKFLRENFMFRMTFRNLDELKKGYEDIYVFLLQREREKKLKS